jgi:hypothetical protein
MQRRKLLLPVLFQFRWRYMNNHPAKTEAIIVWYPDILYICAKME